MILEYKKLLTIYASGACCSILYILYFSSISIFLFLSKRFACLLMKQSNKKFIILVQSHFLPGVFIMREQGRE